MLVSFTDKVSGLKAAALSLGILYTVAHIIQVFGFAVVMIVSPQRCRFRISSLTHSDLLRSLRSNLQRRLNLVRIYAYGSVLTALCVLAGSLTQIVIHYLRKVSTGSPCSWRC